MFGVLVSICFLFGGGLLSLIILSKSGVSAGDLGSLHIGSSEKVISTFIWMQLVTHAATFLIPSLIFALIISKTPFKFLGLKKIGNSKQPLLVMLIALAAIPVFIGISSIFQQLHFLGTWGQNLQNELESKEAAIMNMTSFKSFLLLFFTMAVLPAAGEELLFRGVLMRLITKSFRSVPSLPQTDLLPKTASSPPSRKSIIASIFITAILFTAMHMNVYGALSIFLAGLLLGYIYYLTGSLWCSILFHLLNNGVQVALSYFGNSNRTVKNVMESNSLPAPFVIISFIILIASIYLLVKNKTPLPADWPNDFEGEAVFENQS